MSVVVAGARFTRYCGGGQLSAKRVVMQGRRLDSAQLGNSQEGPVMGYKIGTMHSILRGLREAFRLRGVPLDREDYMNLRSYVFGTLARMVSCPGSGCWLGGLHGPAGGYS